MVGSFVVFDFEKVEDQVDEAQLKVKWRNCCKDVEGFSYQSISSAN